MKFLICFVLFFEFFLICAENADSNRNLIDTEDDPGSCLCIENKKCIEIVLGNNKKDKVNCTEQMRPAWSQNPDQPSISDANGRSCKKEGLFQCNKNGSYIPYENLSLDNQVDAIKNLSLVNGRRCEITNKLGKDCQSEDKDGRPCKKEELFQCNNNGSISRVGKLSSDQVIAVKNLLLSDEEQCKEVINKLRLQNSGKSCLKENNDDKPRSDGSNIEDAEKCENIERQKYVYMYALFAVSLVGSSLLTYSVFMWRNHKGASCSKESVRATVPCAPEREEALYEEPPVIHRPIDVPPPALPPPRVISSHESVNSLYLSAEEAGGVTQGQYCIGLGVMAPKQDSRVDLATSGNHYVHIEGERALQEAGQRPKEGCVHIPLKRLDLDDATEDVSNIEVDRQSFSGEESSTAVITDGSSIGGCVGESEVSL